MCLTKCRTNVIALVAVFFGMKIFSKRETWSSRERSTVCIHFGNTGTGSIQHTSHANTPYTYKKSTIYIQCLCCCCRQDSSYSHANATYNHLFHILSAQPSSFIAFIFSGCSGITDIVTAINEKKIRLKIQMTPTFAQCSAKALRVCVWMYCAQKLEQRTA